MAKSRMIGGKAHAARLRKLAGEGMVREVGKALVAAGGLIEDEAKGLIMAGSASGRSGGKHQHVPSKPGEAPNNDLGGLHGNIETNQVAPLVVEVSSNADYAAALEFGTSKMAARPYFQPARDAKKKEAIQLVRQAVNRAIRKSKSSS